jgi:hypothetical protein
MQVVNLTPHEIVIVDEDSGTVVLVIPPSGKIARVSAIRVATHVAEVNGVRVPFFTTQYGEVEGLPSTTPDTCYLVSKMVADRCIRDDLLVVSELVRDKNGKVVGTVGLERA